MKIKHLLTISIMAVLIIPQLSCNKEWAATIDGKKIYMDEFNKVYYSFAKNALRVDTDKQVDEKIKELLEKDPRQLEDPRLGQILDKNKFIKAWIGQKLLYQKAMNDKNFNKDELNTILELQKIQVANEYYISKKFRDGITPSEDEIERIYKENPQFRRMTYNEASDYIKQQLAAQKMFSKYTVLLETTMAERVIEYNYDALKKSPEKPKEEIPSETKPEEKK